MLLTGTLPKLVKHVIKTSFSGFTSNNHSDLTLDILKSKFSKLNKPNHYDQLLRKDDYISKLKRASVLIPISIRSEEDANGKVVKKSYFTLTKRTETLRTHKGEVCFTGGKMDSTDTDEAFTAYREAKEECNLNAKDTFFLAQLCPIITFNQLLVTPVVVYFDQTNFKPMINKNEVEMIFDLPTERFLSKNDHETKVFKNKSGEYLIHYFKDFIQGREVITWGFTSFLSILISSIVHSKQPDFKLIANMEFEEKNINHYLEKYLKAKLAVSREYFKNK